MALTNKQARSAKPSRKLFKLADTLVLYPDITQQFWYLISSINPGHSKLSPLTTHERREVKTTTG